MKVAHVYPGLRFKALPMKKELFNAPDIQQRLKTAQAATGVNLAHLCQSKDFYQNWKECYTAVFVASHAVGEHYVSLHGNPDLIVGSSFGNFTALVMANSIRYQAAFEIILKFAELADLTCSNLCSFLTFQNSPIPIIDFLSQTADFEAIVTPYEDGICITIKEKDLEKAQKVIAQAPFTAYPIPVRLKYHSEKLAKIEATAKPLVNQLEINYPDIPVLSTFSGGILTNPEEIRIAIGNWMSGPFIPEPVVDYLQGFKRVHMKIHRYDQKKAAGRN